MTKTIASAKNVVPGPPESIGIQSPGGASITCESYVMTYDPFERKTTPTLEPTNATQG